MRILLIASLSLIQIATSSDERMIPPQAIVLKIPGFGVEAAIESGDKFGLVLSLDGKLLTIPAEEIAGIKDIHTKDAGFLTGVGSGGPIPQDHLRTSGFIFSFAYGGSYDHGKEDGDEVRVYKRCRLHFGPNGIFEQIEKQIPFGEFKNQWQLLAKPAGREEYDNGIVDSVQAPMK